MSPSSLVAFVVSVGFACGLNVYAVAFALGLIGRAHLAPLPERLVLLENPCLAAAALLWVGAKYARRAWRAALHRQQE